MLPVNDEKMVRRRITVVKVWNEFRVKGFWECATKMEKTRRRGKSRP